MGLFARFGRSGRTLLLPIPRSSWAGSGRYSGVADLLELARLVDRLSGRDSSEEAKMMRKANSAAHVNRNTPLREQ